MSHHVAQPVRSGRPSPAQTLRRAAAGLAAASVARTTRLRRLARHAQHPLAGTAGSLPPPSFHPPPQASIIYKATAGDREAYSAFQDTSLDRELRAQGVRSLFVGGLATDYCVLNSVKDGLRLGYTVHLLMDGICAVNARPTDGQQAEDEMIRLGAHPIRLEDLAT